MIFFKNKNTKCKHDFYILEKQRIEDIIEELNSEFKNEQIKQYLIPKLYDNYYFLNDYFYEYKIKVKKVCLNCGIIINDILEFKTQAIELIRSGLLKKELRENYVKQRLKDLNIKIDNV